MEYLFERSSLLMGEKAQKTLSNRCVAVIGVGENNKFGHPNNEIISRLENSDAKIFRTDQMGEIIIKIDKQFEEE